MSEFRFTGRVSELLKQNKTVKFNKKETIKTGDLVVIELDDGDALIKEMEAGDKPVGKVTGFYRIEKP